MASFQIQAAVGKDISVNELLPAFNSLLKDMEGEVRSAAAAKIQSIVISYRQHNISVLKLKWMCFYCVLYMWHFHV